MSKRSDDVLTVALYPFDAVAEYVADEMVHELPAVVDAIRRELRPA